MANPIHDPNYVVFREMLLEVRLAKSILQADLADKLGKNQSFVSKYERGERRLDFPEFIEVAAALDIPPSDFIVEYQRRVAKLKMP